MNKQKGNVLLLLLISVLLVAAVASYFYSQSTKEGQQQQKTIKFAATEEAKDLITLDKAAHKWMDLWADEAKTKKNYERLVDYDRRYEIPIDEMIEAGLLTDSFAERFGGDAVSVYGIPYTSSVIKRTVGLGTNRTCISSGPNQDPIGDCESSAGGVCTPYLYSTGRCLIEETEDKYSILTTLGTKGDEPTSEPQLVCPFKSQSSYGSTMKWMVNAPGFDELQLKGSCKTLFPMDDWSAAPMARNVILTRVNNVNSAVLGWGADLRTEISMMTGPPHNEALRCRLVTDRYYSPSDYDSAVAFAAPDIVDSVVVCDVLRVASGNCETHISYCNGGVNQPISNPVNSAFGACSASHATSEASRLNNNDPLFGWAPYNGYDRDAPWACAVTSSSRIDCSAEFNCSGGGPGGTCPAFLNYTKDGTLLIDKDQFATYPRACDEALRMQAEGEVAGAYASHSPALKWDNGPVCGIAPGGMEIICSGSENDGGGTGNIACEIYKYNTEGDGPGFIHDYPGQSCYD